MDDMIRPPRRPRIDLNDRPDETAGPVIIRPEINPESDEAPVEALEAAEAGDAPASEAPETAEERPAPKKRRFNIRLPKGRKQLIAVIAAAVVLLGGISFAAYWFALRDTPAPPVVQQQPEPEPEPEPEPIYSIVSGRELTDESINDRPIYAVQIENSMEARPQSGLREADIITEAVAEGGITRFNAVFHDNIPANIGPVRSLRPYYIDWFLPYDAAIVHAGGSPEALQQVRSLGLKDMDSVSSIMRRISQRYSPHNYYTRGQQVLDLAVERGYKPNVADPLPRKEAAPAETPDASLITVRISSAHYNVRYTWDKATGTYLREQGGSKHVDAESGKQLAPNVVIVPIMSKRLHRDGIHTEYTTVGSGKVFVFQDGTVTVGTWSKTSRSAQWVLKDSAGAEIELNPGQTWFTVTDTNGNVSYQ